MTQDLFTWTLSTRPEAHLDTDLPVVQEVVEWLRAALADQEVDAGDNFLEVGGHSMMAVELNTWLRQQHGLETDVAELFQLPIGQAVRAALAHG